MARRRTVSLAEVAQVYSEAADAGKHPTVTVAETFGAPRSTVANWIADARSEGLLPSTRPGCYPHRHPSLVQIANDLDVGYDELRASILRHIPSGHMALLSNEYRTRPTN